MSMRPTTYDEQKRGKKDPAAWRSDDVAALMDRRSRYSSDAQHDLEFHQLEETLNLTWPIAWLRHKAGTGPAELKLTVNTRRLLELSETHYRNAWCECGKRLTYVPKNAADASSELIVVECDHSPTPFRGPPDVAKEPA